MFHAEPQERRTGTGSNHAVEAVRGWFSLSMRVEGASDSEPSGRRFHCDILSARYGRSESAPVRWHMLHQSKRPAGEMPHLFGV
jgi:hypothetical protein